MTTSGTFGFGNFGDSLQLRLALTAGGANPLASGRVVVRGAWEVDATGANFRLNFHGYLLFLSSGFSMRSVSDFCNLATTDKSRHRSPLSR